jgi:antitoxin (DNA-binding transcriptional repressor) of toxin-antitoxin stability system
LWADQRTNTIEIDLSRLVDQAPNGEPFVIAKAGKSLVRVSPTVYPRLDRRTLSGVGAKPLMCPPIRPECSETVGSTHP